MFDAFGLEKQVYELMSSRVELENGAYLIFDHTEALTAVDVNTGRFIGDTNLEDTVFSTNLLAAKEIARQVRLRNIGGIVVVDFIDMASEEHRNTLIAELEKYLQEDRSKCNVVPMTGLGPALQGGWVYFVGCVYSLPHPDRYQKVLCGGV